MASFNPITRCTVHLSRLPLPRLVMLFALLVAVPVISLAYLSIDRASDTVQEDARTRVQDLATLSARGVGREMAGVKSLIESYAHRKLLTDALDGSPREAGRLSVRHLTGLKAARTGFGATWITDEAGRLLEIRPRTPEAIGADLSFRDWYNGASATTRSYVSSAFVGIAKNKPRVVGTAAAVYTPGGRVLGYIGAAYETAELQRFVTSLTARHSATVRIIDQEGVALAAPGLANNQFESHLGEPGVRAGLAGRSGLSESDETIRGYAAIPELGWVVTVDVPRSVAMAPVSELERLILPLTGVVLLLLSAALVFLFATLRQRAQADARAEAQVAVTRVLADADSLERALPSILGALATALSCRYGAFWNREEDELRATALWHDGSVRARGFAGITHDMRLPRGAGLPGYVWECMEAVSVQSLKELPCAVRASAAEIAGLGAAVALPVTNGGELVGVIELFSDAGTVVGDDVLQMLESCGTQIGQFVERRRTQEALDQAGQRMTRMIASTPAIVEITDREGRYEMVNATFERFFGVRGEDIIGRTREEVHGSVEDHRRVLGTGELIEQELDVEHAGSTYTFLTSRFPITDDTGAAVGVCSMSVDITERKLAEQAVAEARTRALEASRLKSEFVANMSHELRTPLNGVIGMTDLLLKTELEPAQREYAETARVAGEALLSLISDILDFSRIEAGRLDIDVSDADLSEIVGDSCAIVSESAHRKGVELTAWIDPEVPPRMRLDDGRVRQVLVNLLSNAVKFTHHGEINVRVVPAPDRIACVRFEVQDSGIGMDDVQLGKIFEAFTQADTSTTRMYGGSGLGLTISRQLVELMGGSLTVESTAGRGSCFAFTLPIVEPRSSQSPLGHAGFDDLHCLIVDDNATSRSILEHQLSSWGISSRAVDGAESAMQAAVEAAATGRPYGLVLLDFQMPVTDGVELTRMLRAAPETSELPIVMLTYSGDERDAADAAGANACVTKPVRPSRLFDAIIGVIAREHQIATAHVPAPALAKGKVLVVEDNEVNQLVARLMLEQLGYSVDLAGDGAEGARMALAGEYLAVFMDCQMPVMDGYEATREILNHEGARPHTPIIAMTAHSLRGDREKCLQAGMDDYVSKPVRESNVVAALTRVARKAEPGAPEVALLDLDAVAALRSDCPAELLPTIVEMFERDTGSDVAELEALLAAGDAEPLACRAHKIRGAAQTVGAGRLAAVCLELERAGREERLADAAPLVAAITAAFPASLELLQRELTAVAQS